MINEGAFDKISGYIDGLKKDKKNISIIVGGKYDNPADPAYMHGQMYVEYQIPVRARKYPLVLIHGGSHTGVGWQTTPDGRPGWADYFVRRGWKVYNVDQPGRGRSNYVPEAYGPLGNPTTSIRYGVFPPITTTRGV